VTQRITCAAKENGAYLKIATELAPVLRRMLGQKNFSRQAGLLPGLARADA